jgi:hypothetical protein
VIPYSEEIIRCRRADTTVGPHQPDESPLPDTAYRSSAAIAATRDRTGRPW